MTKIEDYLTELDGLLVDVDPVTREGLVNGIREELSALAPADADTRLRALGDPAFVAASVRAERGTLTLQKEDAAWYSILTVLLLTVGGFIIPGIGWLAGLVMLWASRTWAVSHKVIGTLVALGGPGLAAAGLLPWAFVAVGPGESSPQGPIVPLILFGVLLIAWLGAAIWLLVIADRLRRSGRAVKSYGANSRGASMRA